jgi:hypothetical protein
MKFIALTFILVAELLVGRTHAAEVREKVSTYIETVEQIKTLKSGKVEITFKDLATVFRLSPSQKTFHQDLKLFRRSQEKSTAIRFDFVPGVNEIKAVEDAGIRWDD